MNNLTLQGPVPLTTNTYITRNFEKQVSRQIVASQWVTLLGPRQHGKTSGLLRIKNQLVDQGYKCIYIDLQDMPPFGCYKELLEWFAEKVAKTFTTKVNCKPEGIDANDLYIWLEAVIPANSDQIVIIIDEASAIKNEEWRTSFYQQLRAIYTKKAFSLKDELASRLFFIFSGTFRPEVLVTNENSPFNVSTTVVTEDFSIQDAQNLYERLTGAKNEKAVELSFELVAGQPFLLQFLFSRIFTSLEDDIEQAINNALSELYETQESHFDGVFKRILSDPHLSSIVTTIATEGKAIFDPSDSSYKFLITLGIAKREGRYLIFRNRLYQDFVKNSPQFIKLPIKSTSSILLICPEEDTFNFMSSNELKEYAFSMECGGVKAYNSGSYRLALAGFGSALEAILLDFFLALPAAEISKAIILVKSDPKSGITSLNSNPRKWKFVELIAVANKILKPKIDGVADSIREWRNLIHPEVALKKFSPEITLELESRVANALLMMARRSIASYKSQYSP